MHTVEVAVWRSTCGIWFWFIALLQGEECGRSKAHRKLDKWKAARSAEDKEPGSGKEKQGRAKGKTAKVCEGMREDDKMESRGKVFLNDII